MIRRLKSWTISARWRRFYPYQNAVPSTTKATHFMRVVGPIRCRIIQLAHLGLERTTLPSIPRIKASSAKKNGETSIFNAEAGVYTVPMDGTYIFEFHATKAARWNKDSRSDMSTCIVRLVKEVDNDKGSFTVSTISMGKVVAMDWYSTFAVQLESIVALKKGERIAVRLDDGEILGGWLTTFTGFLIAPEKIPSFCDLE